MLFLRITMVVCIVVFLLANIVYPAFKKNVPFFWMFRIRRVEKKYEHQLEKLDNEAMENAVLKNIEQRQDNNN